MEVTGLTAISSITIHIENGTTLTIPQNAELCLLNGAELIIDENSNLTVNGIVTISGRSLVEVTNGSKFNLSYYSSLYGTEHTIWEDPATGQRYDTWEEAS